jgi:hypothetical protein
MVPFHIPDLQVLAEAWENRKSLSEFTDDEDTRDLRSNEERLPDMFKLLGKVIEHGEVSAIEDYEGNIPDSVTGGENDD